MKTIETKKKPCSRCPYTLGLIQTVTNPCPECRLNGYRSYEWFQKQLSRGCPDALNGAGMMNKEMGRHR